MPTGHLGIGPGLIDEHESVRVEIELPLEPLLALLQEARAVQLDSVRSLFCA